MVLVIHRHAAATRDVVDMFRYMDILAYGTQPKDVPAQICARYRAVLLLYPELIPDLTAFLSQLRATDAEIPLFAISDAPHIQNSEGFLYVFSSGVMSSTVAQEMIRISVEHHLPAIGDYRLAGVDASYQLYQCRIHGKPVDLTATEARILRLLIRTYPAHICAADMLPYIFPAAKQPDAATVRTHICAIKAKLRACGASVLIELTPHHGYRIAVAVTTEEDVSLTV